MYVFNLVAVWLFIVFFWLQEFHESTNISDSETGDMKEFFDHIEKVMDKLMIESKSGYVPEKSDSRKLRYLIPEVVANQENEENIYNRINKLGAVNNLPSSQNSPFYSSRDMDGRNTVVDFEGYQEFIFRPLYPCDSYDSAQKHCILRRQLGTTLTLGVQVGEGMQRGMRIYWYRCLRKKHFDHIIKEPLNKGFLPWNLNLGGSSNELRISPISEMDLSYNYFIAELATPRAYRGEEYTQKPKIRFDIESIEIDMGTLYHGEEIVVYARSFMELPRTSVNFLWSLQEKNEFEDHGLPSNMELNAERSSVIIKELKTYHDQYLVCKVFSNKDFLLVKRTFLFRGFGKNKRNITSTPIRLRRYVKDIEQPYRKSSQMGFEETEDPPNIAKLYTAVKEHDTFPEPEANFHEIPEIPPDLFYENSHNDVNQNRDLKNYKYLSSGSHNSMARLMRRFIQKDESGIDRREKTEELPPLFEKPRFEDIESQMIATCKIHSDCNIRARCVRESNYGQNFCRCSHGYNGNGLFCFSS